MRKDEIAMVQVHVHWHELLLKISKNEVRAPKDEVQRLFLDSLVWWHWPGYDFGYQARGPNIMIDVTLDLGHLNVLVVDQCRIWEGKLIICNAIARTHHK
jgi:hypothetical protein